MPFHACYVTSCQVLPCHVFICYVSYVFYVLCLHCVTVLGLELPLQSSLQVACVKHAASHGWCSSGNSCPSIEGPLIQTIPRVMMKGPQFFSEVAIAMVVVLKGVASKEMVKHGQSSERRVSFLVLCLRCCHLQVTKFCGGSNPLATTACGVMQSCVLFIRCVDQPLVECTLRPIGVRNTETNLSGL